MNAIRARASRCIVAAFVGAAAACAGAPRGAERALPAVRIGTFHPLVASFLAGVLTTEPLVSVGWDGRPEYRLAESATTSSDGATLVVRLRAGVTFHSGEVVTAARVRDLLVPKVARLDTSSEIASIDAAGDRTLVIRLRRAHAVKPEDLGDFLIDDAKRVELRTGAFRVASAGPPAVLEPFDGYYHGAPAVPRVEILEFPSHRAAWTAMMRRDVNFLHEVSREAIDFLQDGGHVQAYPLLRPYVIALAFNIRHPVLGRREVRIAINEAVDRAEIVATGMRGHGLAAEGPFWVAHWASPRTGYAHAFNPQAAVLRLAAAGLPLRERGASGMPSRFAFTALMPHDTRFERIALVLQRQLYAIGVDMQFRLFSSVPEFMALLRRGEYDAFVYEMATGRTLTFPYQFWHSRTSLTGTGYAAADAALDRMRVAGNDEEVRRSVADVMRIMRADPPAVFLAFPREARAADKAFAIPYERDHDILGTLRLLRPAPPETAP